MKIKIQITVESDKGEPEVVQEVAHLDRFILRPETLGLTLAEARSILAGIEQTVVEQQAAEFMALQRTCSHCGHDPDRVKTRSVGDDYNNIVKCM